MPNITRTTAAGRHGQEQEVFEIGGETDEQIRYPADELSEGAVEAIEEARRKGDVAGVTHADGAVTLCTIGRQVDTGMVLLLPQGRPHGYYISSKDVRSISVDGRKVYEDLTAYEATTEPA